jgi:pyruvate kinase
MDVARLNFSYGTRQEHAARIERLRKLEREFGRPIAILQDLPGPKLRIRELPEGVMQLRKGEAFVLNAGKPRAELPGAIFPHPEALKELRRGHRIRVADGLLELAVVSASEDEAKCRVIRGGELRSRQGLHFPDTTLSLAGFTEQDKRDLLYGLEIGVDYAALSFVQAAQDITRAREVMRRAKAQVPLIAKIETREAVRELDSIVESADAIMVARGDLGVELPVERVPELQKQIIALCRASGKPVITATQMLESMVENPSPTRAEVTDVANAILDGSDALMLSGETAAGAYPVEAVRIMSRVAAATERSRDFFERIGLETEARAESSTRAIGRAACELAHSLRAKAIITSTTSGLTARMVAMHRPRCPILAATPHAATWRRLALVWGVQPLLVPPSSDTDTMVRLSLKAARKSGAVKKGDLVVITAGVPVGVPGNTNLIQLRRVPY